jgi:2,3-bisphosphoglycerate-independent phosphoglycerate mutase
VSSVRLTSFFVGHLGRAATAVEGGKQSDLAPTMLTLMGMEVPAEMTGKPLMVLK